MTDRDIERIAEAIVRRFDEQPPQGIPDAAYKKLDENALSDIRNRLDGAECRLGGVEGRLGSLARVVESRAEDLAKLPHMPARLQGVNRRLGAGEVSAGMR